MTLVFHLSMAMTGLATAAFSAGAWLVVHLRVPRADRPVLRDEVVLYFPPERRSHTRDAISL